MKKIVVRHPKFAENTVAVDESKVAGWQAAGWVIDPKTRTEPQQAKQTKEK